MFGAARTTYEQIWPNMTENGRFGGLLRVPRAIFGEPMRVQPIPRDVRSIVQPYSTSVQPRAAWAFYVCSTWFMQVLGDFWAVFGFPGLSRPPPPKNGGNNFLICFLDPMKSQGIIR